MSRITIAKLGPRVKILIPIDAARSRDLENRGFGQQIPKNKGTKSILFFFSSPFPLGNRFFFPNDECHWGTDAAATAKALTRSRRAPREAASSSGVRMSTSSRSSPSASASESAARIWYSPRSGSSGRRSSWTRANSAANPSSLSAHARTGRSRGAGTCVAKRTAGATLRIAVIDIIAPRRRLPLKIPRDVHVGSRGIHRRGRAVADGTAP